MADLDQTTTRTSRGKKTSSLRSRPMISGEYTSKVSPIVTPRERASSELTSTESSSRSSSVPSRMYGESSTTPVTVPRSSPRIAGYAGRPCAITMTTPEADGVAACTPGTRDTS